MRPRPRRPDPVDPIPTIICRRLKTAQGSSFLLGSSSLFRIASSHHSPKMAGTWLTRVFLTASLAAEALGGFQPLEQTALFGLGPQHDILDTATKSAFIDSLVANMTVEDLGLLHLLCCWSFVGRKRTLIDRPSSSIASHVWRQSGRFQGRRCKLWYKYVSMTICDLSNY